MVSLVRVSPENTVNKGYTGNEYSKKTFQFFNNPVVQELIHNFYIFGLSAHTGIKPGSVFDSQTNFYSLVQFIKNMSLRDMGDLNSFLSYALKPSRKLSKIFRRHNSKNQLTKFFKEEMTTFDYELWKKKYEESFPKSVNNIDYTPSEKCPHSRKGHYRHYKSGKVIFVEEMSVKGG